MLRLAITRLLRTGLRPEALYSARSHRFVRHVTTFTTTGARVRPNQFRQESESQTLYNFSVKCLDGSEMSLGEFESAPVALIVNTASKDMASDRNLKELQQLYEKHKDRGFVVLAFPCDQFFGEEPLNDSQLSQHVKTKGITFPFFAKVNVNGADAHPLFTWLKEQAEGTVIDAVKWNFTKFLVVDGVPVKRYGPTEMPLSFEQDIVQALDEVNPDYKQRLQEYELQHMQLVKAGGSRHRIDGTQRGFLPEESLQGVAANAKEVLSGEPQPEPARAELGPVEQPNEAVEGIGKAVADKTKDAIAALKSTTPDVKGAARKVTESAQRLVQDASNKVGNLVNKYSEESLLDPHLRTSSRDSSDSNVAETVKNVAQKAQAMAKDAVSSVGSFVNLNAGKSPSQAKRDGIPARLSALEAEAQVYAPSQPMEGDGSKLRAKTSIEADIAEDKARDVISKKDGLVSRLRSAPAPQERAEAVKEQAQRMDFESCGSEREEMRRESDTIERDLKDHKDGGQSSTSFSSRQNWKPSSPSAPKQGSGGYDSNELDTSNELRSRLPMDTLKRGAWEHPNEAKTTTGEAAMMEGMEPPLGPTAVNQFPKAHRGAELDGKEALQAMKREATQSYRDKAGVKGAVPLSGRISGGDARSRIHVEEATKHLKPRDHSAGKHAASHVKDESEDAMKSAQSRVPDMNDKMADAIRKPRDSLKPEKWE